MKKKIVFLSLIAILICLVLTGCDVNINVKDDEEASKEKNSSRNRKATFMEEEEEFYYSKVNYSFIDLGDRYYIVIYGNDEEGHTTWEYETEKMSYEEYVVTDYMGNYKDEVIFILENGTIKLLNADSGEVITSLEEEFVAGPYYQLDYEKGILHLVYGENLTNYLAINTKGKILKKIDLSEYNSLISSIPSANWNISFDTWENNELKMIGATEWENYKEVLVKIDLNTYDVTASELVQEPLTREVISGKALYYENAYENYYFNEDGTFDVTYNNGYVDKFSVIRREGTWKVEENNLILHVDKIVLTDGGYYQDDDELGRILVDYNEKEILADCDWFFITQYYPDYDGKEMVSMDETLYELLEPVG